MSEQKQHGKDGHPPIADNFLLQLLRRTPDNIYFKDAAGRFLLISDAMARYCHYADPADARGKTDFDIFSEEHAQQAYEDEQSILKTGTPIIGKEEKETWPDGHETWVSTSKEPLFDDEGSIIGTFGISRDITARKEAEARATRYAERLKAANDGMLADLALAGDLQTALLPGEYPVFPPGTNPEHSTLRFAHVYEPSQTVSGDLFSVHPQSDTEAFIFISDGIGHGVRAALLASMLSALLRDRIRADHSPAECLARLDRSLRAILKAQEDVLFATAFCLTVNAGNGEVTYANAGHLSPLILRGGSGTVEPLETGDKSSGPALGLMENATFRS